MQVELMLYLAWLVPSSVSFLGSCAVIYYILWLNPGFKDKIFHQVSLFLAAADFLQCFAWFIGVKYAAKYNQCAVQEYIFQAGTIFKAVGTVFICAVAAHTISARRNPSLKMRRKYAIGCITITLFFLALSMSCESARLFCDANIDKYSEASWKMKLAMLSYFFAFAAPVYLSSLVDVAFFVFMRYRLDELLGVNTNTNTDPEGSGPIVTNSSDRTISHQSGEFENSVAGGMNQIRNSEIVLVVNRLIAYPLIFFLGWLPDSIALVIIIATGRDTLSARLFTNATAGSTGWAMVLSYFYFEWKIRSAKADKTFILPKEVPTSSDNSFMRSTDVPDQPRQPRVMHLGLESETIAPSEVQRDSTMAWPKYGDGTMDAHTQQSSSFAMHIEPGQNYY